VAAVERGRFESAILRFLGAAEALSRIRGADVTAERLQVSRMLAQAERRAALD
jgi:hypothetical protein